MEQNIKKYDYVVVGAGSGGIASARRAAMYGKKVALIENKVVGGCCVNVGCVPKKIMFNLANFLEEAQVMKGYGVSGVDDLKLDFAYFKKQRDAYIERLHKVYFSNIENAQIDYVKGVAKFVSEKVIEVNNGETKEQYTAEHIMIASGSAPQMATGDNSDLCLSSDDIFDLDVLPKSMIVLGGGYIGIEISMIMNAFGVKVTVLTRDIFLRHVDKEIVDLLIENMKNLGLDVREKMPFKEVKKLSDNEIAVYLENGDILTAEKVLVSVGRGPQIDGLGLGNAGIVIEKGAIKVDEYQNTNVKGVYAIGDVTNHVQLTPVAIRAGRITAERIFNGKTDLKMDYSNIPTVIFSHPPIGEVGMHEEAAKKKFGEQNIKVYRSKFTNMFYSLANDEKLKQKSLFKVICHVNSEKEEKVVGVHAMGKGVDELMQAVGVAVKMGATKRDLDHTVAIHPTAAEELVLMDPKFE